MSINSSRRFVSSLGKAFQILSAFSADQPELGATELAQYTSLDRTTIQRFLASLVQVGVLMQNPQTRKYRLGLHLLDYSYALLDSLEVRRLAIPHLLDLQRETGKVLTIGVADETDVIIVERLWGSEVSLNLINQIGARFPMYASAMGRCIMAWQPPAVLDTMLERTQFAALTPRTIADSETLLRRLDDIRSRHFDLSDQELYPGACALAVPLRGTSGIAVGAVGLTAEATTTRIDDLVEQFAPKLIAVAAHISLALGHRSYADLSSRAAPM